MLRDGDAAGAGISEAAVDPGQFGVGGGVFAGGEGGFDLGRIGGAFGLGLGGPGGGAGQGFGEGPVGHCAILAWWAGDRSVFDGWAEFQAAERVGRRAMAGPVRCWAMRRS